jgi:hypothetical protein
MEWCKLYASLPRDRDLRRAGEAATLLFVFGLCYVADEETDGFIDDDALPDFRLPRVVQRAEALVRVGVWDRVSDGYVIPGWKEKQRELYAIMEKRRRDADRMARKRKESRDSRATGRGKVAPESREEQNPPNPPAPQGGRRCAVHKRPKDYCDDCHLPPLAPVPPWCGQCDSDEHRWVEDPHGRAAHCPRCHPSTVRSA